MPTCTDDPGLCQGSTPVCHEGTCVPCTPDEDALCAGETPWCNPATNACEACSYHEHCPDSACNVFTGACLDATPETVGPGGDYPTLTLALATAGAEAVFLVSPDTGGAAYSEVIEIGKTGPTVIALLAQNGRPAIDGLGLPPTVTVYNGATLLLEGIDLRLNGNAVAVQTSGLVALDRVEITQNSGGGINATGTAELLVRNSIIAGNGTNTPAVVLSGATFDAVFSSIAGPDTSGMVAAISCTTSPDLSVRNSVLFKVNSGSTLEGCSAATIDHTAGDEQLSGTGNTTFTVEPSLFENLGNGNLRLTAAGKAEFDGVALWQPGDPVTDIDGALRPTAEGPDVAGAHLGP